MDAPRASLAAAAWPDAVRLTSGRLSADLAPEGLRHLTVDAMEILTNLYPAVRATDWSVLHRRPVSQQVVEEPDGGITVRREEVLGGCIVSRWQATASPTGHLACEVELRVRADCELNRWGFNLCLNAEQYAGARLGADRDPRLPSGVAAQSAVAGGPVGLFAPSPTVTLRRVDGVRLDIRSDGQLLEIEDQRNWTDATFKIYSGSLSAPRPIVLRAGAVLRQRLTLDATLRSGGTEEIGEPVHWGAAQPLPLIGVQLNDPTLLDRPVVAQVLGRLGLDHLRVDVEPTVGDPVPTVPGWGVPVEVAALFAEVTPEAVDLLAEACGALPEGSRVLVQLDGRRTTDRGIAEAVGERLAAAGASLPTTAGTDVYWTDLNRDRPDVAGGSVSFSITPTVHLDDSESVFSSLPVQRLVVDEARQLLRAEVIVSPITFRQRGRPESAPTDRSARHVIGPSQVDGRLHSVQGAAWTLGSICAVAAGGAASGTWHEMFGRRGLIDDSGGRPWFSPAFHLLAALGASDRPLVRVLGTASDSVAGLVFPERRRVVMASLRPWPQLVDLRSLRVAGAVRHRLRSGDVERAGRGPDWWHGDHDVVGESAQVTVEPFEIFLLRLAPPE